MAGHQRTAETPAGGGQADTSAAAGRRALYYGWAYMLTLWGKGGYGGSPDVEAGRREDVSTSFGFTIAVRLCLY
jgi:hypothetical protein